MSRLTFRLRLAAEPNEREDRLRKCLVQALAHTVTGIPQDALVAGVRTTTEGRSASVVVRAPVIPQAWIDDALLLLDDGILLELEWHGYVESGGTTEMVGASLPAAHSPTRQSRDAPPDDAEPPLSAGLRHRFTYHAPVAGQPAQYERIRAAARAFASVLETECPRFAHETARAIDALDDCVMRANASIARHTFGDFPADAPPETTDR